MTEFETNLDELDYRSVFANRVLKLIYQKHNGNLKEAIEEATPFFEDFENCIPNIYELVYNEIPLYAYFRYITYGRNNYDFTESEFDSAVEDAKQACVLYYK